MFTTAEPFVLTWHPPYRAPPNVKMPELTEVLESKVEEVEKEKVESGTESEEDADSIPDLEETEMAAEAANGAPAPGNSSLYSQTCNLSSTRGPRGRRQGRQAEQGREEGEKDHGQTGPEAGARRQQGDHPEVQEHPVRDPEPRHVQEPGLGHLHRVRGG